MSPNYPQRSPGVYQCSRHRTVAHGEPCHSTIRCATLDEFVAAKLLEALQPAGVELSLQVIENEVARREQLDTLYAQRESGAFPACPDHPDLLAMFDSILCVSAR